MLKLPNAYVQAINLVASCAESEVPGVQIGVLRAILTALTSQRGASGTAPSEEVSIGGDVFHGEPVMVGIRVCYNIAVGSEIAANRATARSALLQLMSTVSKRASVVECDTTSDIDESNVSSANNSVDGVDPSVHAIVQSALTKVITANGGSDESSAAAGTIEATAIEEKTEARESGADVSSDEHKQNEN